MASNNFSISPTAWTGSETMTVQPLDTNYTFNDRRATITITNGSRTRTVSVVQYGVPNFVLTSGSTTVPYTGGTLEYRITSHYRFKFVNKPSWITITAGSTTYLGDTWYTPSSGDYSITFTVSPATSSYDQTSTNFRINFDAANDLHYDLVITLQGLPVQDYLNVVPSIYRIDWDDIDTHRSFTVSCTKEWAATPSDSTNFDWLKLGAYYNCTPLNNNESASAYTATVDFTADALPTVTTTVIQYHKPTLTVSGSTVVPAGGVGKTITVNSNNDWYITGIPAYVSASVVGGSSVDLSHTQDGSDTPRSYILTFAANPDSTQRTATITLHYSNLEGTDIATSYQITFTQEAAVLPVPTISVSPLSVPNTAGEVIITVNSEYSWWIDTLQAPFNGEIYDYDTGDRIYPMAEQQPVTNKQYRVRYSANDVYTTRQARVHFVWRENASTIHSIYTDYVVQAAKTLYSFSLDPSSVDLTSEMQAETFNVTPDVLTSAWTATSSDSWISIIDDSAQTGVASISFDVDDNLGDEARYGEIHINYVGGDSAQERVFYVTQYGTEPAEDFTLDKYEVYLGFIANSKTDVVVDSTVGWYAASSDNWITITGATGMVGVETIAVVVSANNEPEGREGIIEFFDENDVLLATMNVYQYAEYNALFNGLSTTQTNDATYGIVEPCKTTAPVTLVSNTNANLTITYADPISGMDNVWLPGETITLPPEPGNDVSFGRSSQAVGTDDGYVTFTVPINDTTGAEDTITYQYHFMA